MIKTMTKHDVSIFIANAFDHFDIALYGFLVPILAPLLFPQYDPVVQLIMLYGVGAISIITRPLGTIIFSNLVDKYGVLKSLVYSLYGLALATTMLAFLPTYKHIGWWSALILIVLKMLRGIFAAGESTIAKMYVLENKNNIKAFKASYNYQTSSMVGIIVASFISVVVIYYKQCALLWRLAFLLGGISGWYAFSLRKTIHQDKIFLKQSSGSKHFFKTIWDNRQVLGVVALTTGLGHVTYSIPFVIINTMIPLVTDISLARMMQVNTILLVVDIMLIEVLGKYLQRFLAQHIMLIASGILCCTTPGLFYFLPQTNIYYVTFVRVWIVFWGVVFLCPLNLFYKQILVDHNKYFLLGMGSALGATTIGRITPVLCLIIWHVSHNMMFIGVYIAIIALLTAISIKRITTSCFAEVFRALTIR